jgi:hypothetical protein
LHVDSGNVNNSDPFTLLREIKSPDQIRENITDNEQNSEPLTAQAERFAFNRKSSESSPVVLLIRTSRCFPILGWCLS